MSKLSKFLGLDKNKTLLDQINSALRSAAGKQVTDFEKKYVTKCVSKGVPQEYAETCFDVLFDLAT